MALKLDEIRALADRVAASHALEIVDVEYQGGGGKHRTLRIFLEKNEAERAMLRERVARLQAERVGGEDIDSGEDDESGEELDSEVAPAPDDVHDVEELEADGEQDLTQDEADAAFLDGLPSVKNLELLSGITHEDCESFSRDFGTVLDVEELGPGTEYLLEISSPGLDRRLTRISDYQRFVGCLAKLSTFDAVAGNRHWQGRLAEVRGDRIVLDVAVKQQAKRVKKSAAKAEAPQGLVEIALSNVEKAHLVPEF